eukprot:TRINITY_DN12845_c0_g1_i1.p1 TRINITY_DN12845_c0_g1~~TRINITY_DN12845_c0_g1_i1.p1  ORF type:complete len:1341 (+),score=475.78 TRINITY_DN12845_c0_g1_i1:172-4023(+)
MSKDAKTRADANKIAGELNQRLAGKPFLGGSRPSREDAVEFRRLLGGGETAALARWSKHVGSIPADERKQWAAPRKQQPRTLASVAPAQQQKRAATAAAAAPRKQGDDAGEKPSARRDQLCRIELEVQRKWAEDRVFEIDPPAPGEADNGKFMATFPYPYMNGKLHLGHTFTATKAEFAVAYQRLLGKRSIWPFGFHCTGMPIQAAANKLKREYENYGCPWPTFPCGRPIPHPALHHEESGTAPGHASLHLVWLPPTSTNRREVTGYTVYGAPFRKGYTPEWTKIAEAGNETTPIGDPPKQFAGVQLKGLDTAVPSFVFRVVAHLADGSDCPTGASSEEVKLDAKHKKEPKKKGGDGKPQQKAKVAAKTGDAVTQWDIMRGMGMDAEEMVRFTDPLEWLRYFPPRGAADLQRFGAHIDFRRAFITTSENQYYDRFIQWQFRTLKRQDKIAFGKRPTVYSETDGQACMDHDRSEGEGLGPQEYTGIKIELLEPFPAAMAPLKGKKVYLIAATLRPETMCGQTNCWVLPEGRYGCFDAGEHGVFVCSYRAARNMSFQDIFPEWGKPKQLLEVHGQDLIGCPIRAPCCVYDKCYVLPLLTIKMDKGTGIVTSVPADSPDDYACLMELRNPKKQEHYGLKAEWIMPFELVPIIDCPIDGEIRHMSAQYMCEKLGVKSQKDAEQLREAHDVVYKVGFYQGIMTAGEFKGQEVAKAKDLSQKSMVSRGEAITYHEPAGLIVGRSGDECVIALIDQWYLKYGEDQWRAMIEKHVDETLECYNPATQKAFKEAIAWLKGWACSRSFGLGTRIPWDEQFVIESLSDSTIYMAYYSISKYLQGPDNFDGKRIGPAGIKPEDLTDEVFEYIFRKGPYPKGCAIPEAKCAEMRREFEYWYPMDLRVSGKDLIQNHLTFALYNHAAIWDTQPEMWPRSFYTNGMVLVDGEKMSKSKGNFFSLRQACDLFSADACRIACAHAGDGLDDANFEQPTANSAILRLTGLIDFATKTVAQRAEGKLRGGGRELFVDRWFANEMARLVNEAKGSFEGMKYKEALRCCWFDFLNCRAVYLDACPAEPHGDLLVQWLEWQTIIISVICPHVAEHVWGILGKPGSVLNARWPATPAVDQMVLEQGKLLFIKVKEDFIAKRDKAAKKQVPQAANIYVATRYPEWKLKVVRILHEDWTANKGQFSPTVMKDKFSKEAIPKGDVLESKGAQVGKFASTVVADAKVAGEDAFSTELPFDEMALLRENEGWLRSKLSLKDIAFYLGDAADAPDPATQESSAPGKPSINFL